MGACSCSLPRALGAGTRLHVTGRGAGLAAAVVAPVRTVAVVLPLPSLSAPHPAVPARVIITARASAGGRDTAAKDNPGAVPLPPLPRRDHHALLDLDGCVWVGDEPTPGAVEAVTALRSRGEGHRLRHERLPRQRRGSRPQALGPGLPGVARGGRDRRRRPAASPRRARRPAAQRLRDRLGRDRRARPPTPACGWTNGTEFATRLRRRGRRPRRAALTTLKLRTAVQALDRGADLVATGRDPTLPMADGPWPGTGALLAALEYATGPAGCDRRQARPPSSSTPRWTGSAMGVLSSSAIAWTRTSRARSAAGSGRGDRADRCGRRAPTPRRQRIPRRSRWADTLAALVLDRAEP